MEKRHIATRFALTLVAVAVLLPLCFMRISLFASQLLVKKREKGDVS